MKNLSLGFLLSVIIVLLSLTGCREEKVEAETNVPFPAEMDKISEHQKVLAMIGEEEITVEDLKVAMESVPKRRQATAGREILDDFVQNRVFSAEATKVGLDQDPEIKKKVKKAVNETLARYFVKKHIGKEAEPTDEKLNEYYKEHEDQFVIPERVLFQHIVVEDKKKAEELLKELKDGSPFEVLAKDHSICKCSQRGGNHGWFYKERVNEDLREAAFGAEVGKLEGVIETKAGFEVFRIRDKKEEEEVSFQDAKAKIRRKHFLEKKKELMDKYREMAGVNKDPGKKGVLVMIGDEEIPEAVISDILARAPEKEKKEIRRRWIDYFVNVRVFSDEAKKIGLEKDHDVARELRRTKDRVLADAFRKRELSDDITIADEDIANYYKSHKKQFTTPEKVRCKAIRVETRQEAEDIARKLADGAIFSKLAMERSLYPMASRRAGEIGWFSRGHKDQALEKVAFSLKEGQVSDIIKTEAGYEIIKLMEKKAAETKPKDELRDLIKIRLTKDRQEEVKQQYYEKAGVEFLQWKMPPHSSRGGRMGIPPHAMPQSDR